MNARGGSASSLGPRSPGGSGWQRLSLVLIALSIGMLVRGTGKRQRTRAPVPDLNRWENEGGMVATTAASAVAEGAADLIADDKNNKINIL